MKKIYLEGYIFTIGIIVLVIGFVFLYSKVHYIISKPGNYFTIGTHNSSKVFLRATPEYEYQVVMEPDSVAIYYLGETIAKLPYESDLGQILLKDNE